jgi:hypothetical protein
MQAAAGRQKARHHTMAQGFNIAIDVGTGAKRPACRFGNIIGKAQIIQHVRHAARMHDAGCQGPKRQWQGLQLLDA